MLRTNLVTLQATQPPQLPTQGGTEMVREYIAQALSHMISLETKLSKLIAEGDKRAISFTGLGFQSIGKSNAWLEMELIKHPSGLIVDVHIEYHALTKRFFLAFFATLCGTLTTL
jgi:hypothetical protein